MKHILFTILLFTLFVSGVNSQKTIAPASSVIVDTSIGKKILHQCSRDNPGMVDSFWMPTKSNIDILEKNFNNILGIKSTGCCINGKQVDSSKNFACQYLGVVIKGKRYIYINAFVIEMLDHYKRNFKDLTKAPIVICDGGSSFWGALFNIDTKEFSDLNFNGFI